MGFYMKKDATQEQEAYELLYAELQRTWEEAWHVSRNLPHADSYDEWLDSEAKKRLEE